MCGETDSKLSLKMTKLDEIPCLYVDKLMCYIILGQFRDAL